MRFMMMIKSDEVSETGALPDEKLIAAMTRYNDELVNAGALLAAEGLHPSSRGARVKFSRGKPAVTDGPFTEAKELIAGYWLIQAESKDAAVEWAKRMFLTISEAAPESEGGGEVEIRQVYELQDFPVSEKESGWREREAEFRAQPTYGLPDSGNGPGGRLKRFIIFRKADRETEAEAGPAPSEALFAAMGAYNDEMIGAGVLVAGEGLQPSAKGAKVTFRRGRLNAVDGPFTESKELIAGFTMIQVKSKEDAIAWAKRWPALDGHGEFELEVRQVFGADEFAEGLSPELREAVERQTAQIAGKE